MIAFFYANRFVELSELPPLRKLEVLEEAYRRVSAAWGKNLSRFFICGMIGFAIGLAPRIVFPMSELAEGVLMVVGMFVAIQLSQKMYAQLLHEKVKEVLGA